MAIIECIFGRRWRLLCRREGTIWGVLQTREVNMGIFAVPDLMMMPCGGQYCRE